MRPHALAFYAAREREVEQRYAETARLFLSAAAREHGEAFWAERSDAPATGSESAAIQAAFAHLKEAPDLRVRVSTAIAIEPRAYVDGREIRLAPHVVTGQADPGTRYLHNIEVPLLVEMAPTVTQVSDLLAAYTRRKGPVDLHDFLIALSSTVARGWLVAE